MIATDIVGMEWEVSTFTLVLCNRPEAKLRWFRTDEYIFNEKEAYIYQKGTKMRTHYNKGTMGANVQVGPSHHGRMEQ